MSSPERPPLRSVPGGPPGEAGGTPEAARPAGSEARGVLLWGLVLVVLVLAGALAWQARTTAELRGRLADTESALAASQARAQALEGHLASVRERFAGLRSTLQDELEALGALLAAEPGAPASDEAPEAPQGVVEAPAAP